MPSHRPFFQLNCDPSARHAYADAADTLDLLVFFQGRRIKVENPLRNVKLAVGKGQLPDFLDNSGHVPVCSDQFVRCLSTLAANDIEAFPAPLWRRQKALAGYQVVNFRRAIRCLNLEQSSYTFANAKRTRIDRIHEHCIDVEKVPTDVHAFRLRGDMLVILVSAELVRSIKREKLTGLSFSPVVSVVAGRRTDGKGPGSKHVDEPPPPVADSQELLVQFLRHYGEAERENLRWHRAKRSRLNACACWSLDWVHGGSASIFLLAVSRTIPAVQGKQLDQLVAKANRAARRGFTLLGWQNANALRDGMDQLNAKMIWQAVDRATKP